MYFIIAPNAVSMFYSVANFKYLSCCVFSMAYLNWLAWTLQKYPPLILLFHDQKDLENWQKKLLYQWRPLFKLSKTSYYWLFCQQETSKSRKRTEKSPEGRKKEKNNTKRGSTLICICQIVKSTEKCKKELYKAIWVWRVWIKQHPIEKKGTCF